MAKKKRTKEQVPMEGFIHSYSYGAIQPVTFSGQSDHIEEEREED